MSIVMPRVVQTPTPNYSLVAIRHDLFIYHDEEGQDAGSRAWLCDPRAQAAPHLAMNADGSVIYQLVPLQYKAWAQCAFNSAGISLEMPGFVAKGFPDARLRAAALVGAWHCLAYGIPPAWAQGGQGRGICCHHDLGAAGGGHVDVGPVGGETWQKIVQYTQAAYADLKALPSLPSFALHGLPGPADVTHEVSSVTPTPSHGGAARNEPGDVHAHPTASTYPAHSIAALQSDLRSVGETVDVDGWFGPVTQGALRSFQMKHGLTPDGVPGPQSWQALDAAMALAA